MEKMSGMAHVTVHANAATKHSVLLMMCSLFIVFMYFEFNFYSVRYEVRKS